MNQKKTIRAARRQIRMRKLRRFMRNRMAVAGVAVILVILLLCVLAPLLTPYDPIHMDMGSRNLPLSAVHPLGTDNMGRDLWSRMLYGGRISILIGVTGALGATVLGAVLGCGAGYLGGRAGVAIVYVSELFMTFPQYLLVMILVGVLGRSTANLLIIFTFTGWPHMMRVVRTNVLSLREEPYVESCRANGIGSRSIMLHHILPNTMGPVIVNFTLKTAAYILQEASLSFLGMGVPDTVVTWGNILNAAKRLDIIQSMPVLWIAPGLAICLFVLSINFLGDGLRDVLDPTSV